MAKLWEVLKAFDEGGAILATRKAKQRLVELRKNPGNQGVSVYFDHGITELKNDDFAAEDWQIIENPAAKTNDYLMVVCRITDDSKNTWSEHEIFQQFSLNKAFEKMKYEFRGHNVELLSAVASSYNGAVTVLAYEGGMANE